MRPLVEPHLRDLLPYVPGKPIEETEREFGVTNIAKLASNENCLGPSPRATAAVQAALAKGHLYPDAGAFALKARIAHLHDVAPAQIVIGCGTNELITHLCRALLGEGDALLNAWPSFVCYRIGARIVGAPERTVPLDAALNYDLAALADVAAADPSVKLVFLANPNNPIGACFGRDALEAFVARVPDHVVIVLDEAYAEYVERPDYEDAVALIRRRPRTLFLRTFSKIHGLAAYRIGYAVGDVEIMQILDQMRDAFNVSALAQVAALAALDDVEHIERTRAHNRAERPRLVTALEGLGLAVTPSEANFVLATLPESLPLDVPALNLALLQRALIVRPVANYGLPRSVRITVGTQTENDRLLAALAEIVGAAGSRT
ncbi:MAG: histidinol-phosphate transaminase [Deltaproteobacteria bacterium]|nr:histidinol-phosphate transaminase [Deltaproteobacteria bacterium]